PRRARRPGDRREAGPVRRHRAGALPPRRAPRRGPAARDHPDAPARAAGAGDGHRDRRRGHRVHRRAHLRPRRSGVRMIVAMFPGEGPQPVGMGSALADAFPTARRTFEEADDVLGYALSEICFAGPAERLTETDVCQPALVATSTAAFRVAQEEAGL